METMTIFADWMRRQRKVLDLTQAALAERVGCSLATIKKIEQQMRKPSRELAELLAAHLAIPAMQTEIFVRMARGEYGISIPSASLPSASFFQTQAMHDTHRSGHFGARVPELVQVEARPRTSLAESGGITFITAEGFGNPYNNLPIQRTALIGRWREMAAVQQLLRQDEVGLLTLTGPGGSGKTRLGLEVARELLDDFDDGIYFVSLASVRDPNLVVATIAQALGLKEQTDQPLLNTVQGYLNSKQILLILDNFEHVLPAALHVRELLAACPHLKVLATSRAPLHLSGEYEFPVPPLALPDLKCLPEISALSRYPAIELFVQRATAVKPDFALMPANASAIAGLCCRLDGLPLALELAAARIKVFSPQALLARADTAMEWLSGGARDLPARQQTLRATIAWSHDLLVPGEQTLFRRLSVFAGGFSLTVVAGVCNAAGDLVMELLDGTTSLVDKNLLQQIEGADGEPRFHMLETIREFALEQLSASGEAEELRCRHADTYLALAETAELELRSSMQIMWLDWLEAEHGNLRAALQWMLTYEDMEMDLRLAGALWWFWGMRGYLSEGRGWLDAVLARSNASGHTLARARALCGAGQLALRQGNYGAGRSLYQESAEIFRELQDESGLAFALTGLARARFCQSEFSAAQPVVEESLALFRRLGDVWGTGLALHVLGNCLCMQGDHAGEIPLLEQSLTLFRQVGDRYQVAELLLDLGYSIRMRGEYAAASALLQEALAITQELRDKQHVAHALEQLGEVARAQGAYEQARVLREQSLTLYQELGMKANIAWGLLTLGCIAYYQGDYGRALPLLKTSLEEFREIGDKYGVARSLYNLGQVAQAQGDYTRAWALFRESLALAQEMGQIYEIAVYLAALAGVESVQGQAESAARLLGAADTYFDTIDVVVQPHDRVEYAGRVDATRTQLGEAAFAIESTKGRAILLSQVVANVLAQPAPNQSVPDLGCTFTTRERPNILPN